VTDIHPTAVVDKKAELGPGVSVGPFAIIQGDVVIGEGTAVHSHVLIADGARIGKHCQIHHGAAVSTIPQDLKFGGESTLFEIGDHVEIREFCDLNRGTLHRGKSRIGDHSFLMAYSHVAHDCLVGERVILANAVQLGGHVTIEDWVILGGMVGVHQFCSIGRHAIIGGGFRAVQDVPPFITAAGEPLGFKGLNLIGLRRRGFSAESIQALNKAYRMIYRSKLNMSQALERIRAEVPMTPEVETVIAFIEKSERGIIH
jgi:UDP-N-acetylglucosamine acyltransferase